MTQTSALSRQANPTAFAYVPYYLSSGEQAPLSVFLPPTGILPPYVTMS
ncbi:unnamed protein product [Protopolystoma xenopodis]|uniref:Uncharacterized protein n=1 Tax=Protopolystoma xenopodis TaxID=117903 RepID=A0A3S5C923_9PLAT|nr:unnamed protein product [Protopolystoma xenopodis]